ncbi:Type II/IV secretion system ATPase TadZ/CpaE, associated with Flp pilus assembly [hydrothermal vent metagenome]|uniref:Type II/IV secretion system ATPase TadZ/CpaE, associated with Flp pilus assembly n=1 Tax=hydrothermal vent metagenome TaxID=652676 RepID=A0A3B0SHA7_9ZZZZ
MKNAAETAYQHEDEEQGVADSAASLGADGGPSTGGDADASATGVAPYDDGLEGVSDESWLDEELSDEELAALGEEDFDEADLADLDLSDEDFDGEDFLDEDVDASFDAGEEFEGSAGADNATSHTDTTGAGAEPAYVAEQPAATQTPAPPVEEDAGAANAETSGALVTAGAMVEADAYGGAITEIEDPEVDHRPVPRISIHAFCETPAMTTLLEQAAIDRRLSKAHLTIHMGGLAKAVDQFQTAATPNLVILETLASGAEIFAQLGELAEVCDPSTKVVIIGQVNDIILYRELIAQGISEYIVRPHSPLQIIKAIADLYVDPSAPPIGRTLAFVGARGGVGSSTIAHNVGWCSAEEYQSDTIILDLDLAFGTASLDFDQEASAGLYEALSSPERLDDVLLDRLLQKHTDHLSLFTAPSALDRDYDVDDQAYETVLDVVRGSAPTVVVDVPHVWCSWSKRILTTADEIIITATPDLASFRNTKQLVDILSAARPNDAPPTLVINQFDPKMSAVQPDQFVEHVGLKPAAVFNWEPQIFGAATTNAAPIIDVSPKSKAAGSIRELSAHLIGRTEANIAKPKFSLSGLFQKKR